MMVTRTPRHAFDQVRLVTPRLVLRPFVESDAEALFAIFSDPAVMRYMNSGAWASIEPAHEMIARDLRALPAGEFVRLGLTRKDTGALIGMCNLFQFNWQCRRCEIGYCLGRAHWGHGYMHEALTALIDYGFRELDLNRIEADVDPRNVGSVKSLERLGFVREGLLRERWIVEGEVSDSGMYGLLREEWGMAEKP
jgi:RimJ/RimL family protein N-acetyltransferase